MCAHMQRLKFLLIATARQTVMTRYPQSALGRIYSVHPECYSLKPNNPRVGLITFYSQGKKYSLPHALGYCQYRHTSTPPLVLSALPLLEAPKPLRSP